MKTNLKNANPHASIDTLIHFGGEIKNLNDRERRVGGYIVLFGDPKSTDLAGDYFTSETDFLINDGDLTDIYFDHCFDPVLKYTVLGQAAMEVRDAGVWAEGVLSVREEYEEYFGPYLDQIYQLVSAKKLGWSSGTASHLVEREVISRDVAFIKRWPLRLDASLTPSPCEPRTRAEALKSYEFQPVLKHSAPAVRHLEKNYLSLKRDYEEYRFEQSRKRTS